MSELSEAGVPGDSQAPVFVLCAARSGSTLLRFLLDAHPELACPPETKLPAMCTQLAGVWSLLEGTALPGGVTDPDMIPESAVAGMRRTLDDMTGSYLQRKGKRRFCDKSLGTAQHVRLLLRLYPNAKFICLYRHPMDMIASGIEACPWGLTGFGFEPYAAMSPGNSVQALAQFWADNMSAILAVEERFGERCHRVRYEDLVTDPETVADGIFRFVGVAAAPGISRACFSPDRDPFGPADYKIWLTTEITPDSVGRGWAVPATPIRANLREAINGMARKLGYVQVGERWGAAASVPDLRLPGTGPLADAPATRREASTLLQLGHRMLVARLEAGLAAIGDTFIDRWGQYGAETFLLASTPPGGSGMWIRWRVDLAARTLDVVAGVPAADNVAARWEIIGSSSTWEKIINRDLNLSVAIRRRDVRYADTGDGAPARPRVRLSMLADLLGVTVWQSADDTAADEAAAPEVSQLTA